jgi:hypothetical protein
VPGPRLGGALLLVAACLAATVAEAQFGRRYFNPRLATPDDIDGEFHFCRVAFASDPRGGADGGWNVDWPRADINLSVRLAELTRTPVSRDASGTPNHWLVRLTDDMLFECPFIMMTEVGSASLNQAEVPRLREYLLKGGFLWADDFWGSYSWDWWYAQLQKVLPASEFPVVALDATHPLFTNYFTVGATPQIPSINFWADTGGQTSERGADSATARAMAILDRTGRVMVLMTHNTDIGDSFEREADDPQYFLKMSVPGYAFGINALVYGLTH